jgi:hypothetical protein
MPLRRCLSHHLPDQIVQDSDAHTHRHRAPVATLALAEQPAVVGIEAAEQQVRRG